MCEYGVQYSYDSNRLMYLIAGKYCALVLGCSTELSRRLIAPLTTASAQMRLDKGIIAFCFFNVAIDDL